MVTFSVKLSRRMAADRHRLYDAIFAENMHVSAIVPENEKLIHLYFLEKEDAERFYTFASVTYNATKVVEIENIILFSFVQTIKI